MSRLDRSSHGIDGVDLAAYGRLAAWHLTWAVVVLVGFFGVNLVAGGLNLWTGPINLQQTYLADLDNGSVVNDGSSDIWYEAETATEKYITPRNGAMIALGDGSNRGFDGCSDGSFSTDRVSLDDIPPGTLNSILKQAGLK